MVIKHDGEEEQYDLFMAKVVQIARGIADDTYTGKTGPFTYHHGGEGYRETGLDGNTYTTYDCRGMVFSVYRYAAAYYPNFYMSEELKDVYIGCTSYQYEQLRAKGFGCAKLRSKDELQDGDILYKVGHTEIFFRKDNGTPMQVGACQTPGCFYKRDGKTEGSGPATDGIVEKEMGNKWIAYFRYGMPNSYRPPSSVTNPDGDTASGLLGGRAYEGEVDEYADLDEQIFDFQGNPQIMIFEGETNLSLWLFSLLSQFLDFISGLLVSLLINPIMQLLNTIVNFLTNFINYISGLPTGT